MKISRRFLRAGDVLNLCEVVNSTIGLAKKADHLRKDSEKAGGKQGVIFLLT